MKGAPAGADPNTCHLALFFEPFENLQKVVATASKRSQEAYEGYMSTAADSAAIESLVASLERFNNIVNQQMTTNFGSGVAIRAAANTLR